MAFLLAVLTFLIVAMIFLAVMIYVGARGRQDVIKRLEAIAKAERRGQTTLELQLLRDELLSDVPTLNRLMLRWSWPNRLRQFVGQAGWKIKPAKIVLLSAVFALGSYLAARVFYGNVFLALLVGIALGCTPLAALLFKRARRLRTFERNFPEAIDLLARAVRAGHAFTTGLEMIATELPQPVAGEFRIAFEEQNFGLPLKDALLNLTERVPLLDVRFFVTALLVQKETGGNLAEILDKLAYVVRDRFRILGDVRTKSAQGRFTAAMLIAVPPGMIFLLRTINPEYLRPLFEDTWGFYALLIAAGLQIVGSIILWKIVRIEV